jgi:hypothetical protein
VVVVQVNRPVRALSSSTVTPNNLQARFAAVAKKVRADFEESAHTQHRGSRGTEREEILAKFLELYMPGTVEVVHNAEIITTTGEISKQCDIVIVDRNTPKLRDIKSHRIIPVECVYGVVEVKSRLNGPELISFAHLRLCVFLRWYSAEESWEEVL